jgi:hypothetical protein
MTASKAPWLTVLILVVWSIFWAVCLVAAFYGLLEALS